MGLPVACACRQASISSRMSPTEMEFSNPRAEPSQAPAMHLASLAGRKAWLNQADPTSSSPSKLAKTILLIHAITPCAAIP